jgi:hypothetical protein
MLFKSSLFMDKCSLGTKNEMSLQWVAIIKCAKNPDFATLIFFFQYLSLNSGPTSWATLPALFSDGFVFFFKIGSH